MPNFDELAKSENPLFFVSPAKAGIQSLIVFLDSRLRGSDSQEEFLMSIRSTFALF
jgi:hypothetical protein